MTDKKKKFKISRRTFLKSTALTGAVAATSGKLFNSEMFATPVAAAADENDFEIFRNTCPRNCYDTCSILSYVKEGVLTKVEGDPKSTYTSGKLCAKGYSYLQRVYNPDRIKFPMKQKGRGSGHWVRISWDEALDTIAKKILDLKKEYGSTLPICLNKYSGNFDIMHYGVEGMFSSIGYTTRALGTPCWPAGIDAQTFDFGTIWNSDPEDMVNSKYIILWGVNPTWCAVHSWKFIQEARKKGAKIVVIDPIFTQTAAKSDLYIQIKSSTDGALALGMAKYIIDNNLYDEAWMNQNSIGWQDYFTYVKEEVTLDWASQETGIPKDIIEQLAREYATSSPANIWVGYGCQRHTNGGHAVRSIDALGALTGNVGKSGGGIQYAHLETWGFNYYAMSQAYPEGSVGVPDNDGYSDRYININNFGASALAANDPPIKMLWIASRNPLSQDPETSVVEKAFKAMDLVVTVDHFFNRSVAMSDIVLPAATQFEEPGVNASYWHYWVAINQQALKPLYETKSDIEIAMALSKRLNELEPGSCTYPTEGDQEEWLGKEFNQGVLDMLGINDYKQLRDGPRKANLPTSAWSNGDFRTPSGKYEFKSEECASFGHTALPEYKKALEVPAQYPYRLLTPHWKLNIHSQFQNLSWVANISDEPIIEINPITADKKGIKEGDMVKVSNQIGWAKIKASITNNVAEDELATYTTWLKDHNYCINFTVKAIPADMGKKATGMPGVAFHDNFVNVEKV